MPSSSLPFKRQSQQVVCFSRLLKCQEVSITNSVDPDQTAPISAVSSGSMLLASLLNLSVMLGNYLQQTTSADDIFRRIFIGAIRVNKGVIKLCTKFNSFFLPNVAWKIFCHGA